jgi:predicted helicase
MVFATYQSSPQVAKAYELGRVPAFDPVIADEAPLRRTGLVRLSGRRLTRDSAKPATSVI